MGDFIYNEDLGITKLLITLLTNTHMFLNYNRGEILVHRERSKCFVEALADNFRKAYSNDSEVKVFSKHFSENRKEFKLNEYLYDILVCKVDSVISAKQRKTLPYIKRAIWMIESELARDTRQAVLDFNKLAIGNSDYKLFIGSLNSVNMAYLETLLPIARQCNGKVYAALVTHPKYWEEAEIELKIWELKNNWELLH